MLMKLQTFVFYNIFFRTLFGFLSVMNKDERKMHTLVYFFCFLMNGVQHYATISMFGLRPISTKKKFIKKTKKEMKRKI